MAENQIVGTKPSLEGKPFQEFISQAYWHKGELVEEANVVWVRQDNDSHHLCFDCSIIFWRVYDTGPSYEEAQEGDIWVYPLENLIEKYSLSGIPLDRIEQDAEGSAAYVTFKFENGFQVKFESINDVSRIKA